MDTSETYIKMCEKVEKIQEQKPARNEEYYHNWFFCGECANAYHEDDGFYYAYCDCARPVWLPRQDQLQEMVNYAWKDHYKEIDMKHWRFHYWYAKSQKKEIGSYPFGSMEQLWLAFVMKEKYNKAWNGTDWVCPG